MTLCVAAMCRHHEDEEPRLVVGMDTKVSTAMASSENQVKIDVFPRMPFGAVFSGEISEARKLLSRYHSLGIEPNCTVAQLEAQLMEPIHLLKEQMVESLVKRRAGMTYREFLDRSAQFNSGFASKIFSAIEEVAIGTQLLIFGYLRRQPLLFKAEWEEVSHCDHFACIGPGSQAAEQVLHRRGQGKTESLIRTLYNVYEAKRLGEGAPTVGRSTIIVVIEPLQTASDTTLIGNLRVLTGEGLEYLEKCFAKFGPRPVKNLRLPNEASSLLSLPQLGLLRHGIIDDEDEEWFQSSIPR